MASYLPRLASRFYGVTNPGGNPNNNGYPTRIPTTTPPWQGNTGSGVVTAGDGVVMVGGDQSPSGAGATAPRYLQLVPYGVGSDTNTFSLTVLGWRPTNLGKGVSLWVPTPICSCACTIASGLPGIANADLGTTAFFSKLLAVTGGPLLVSAGTAPVSDDWFSITGTAVGAGFLQVPTLGFYCMEVIFTTGGSATSCNSLYCFGG
jgi:hypothetical protein